MTNIEFKYRLCSCLDDIPAVGVSISALYCPCWSYFMTHRHLEPKQGPCFVYNLKPIKFITQWFLEFRARSLGCRFYTVDKEEISVLYRKFQNEKSGKWRLLHIRSWSYFRCDFRCFIFNQKCCVRSALENILVHLHDGKPLSWIPS